MLSLTLSTPSTLTWISCSTRWRPSYPLMCRPAWRLINLAIRWVSTIGLLKELRSWFTWSSIWMLLVKSVFSARSKAISGSPGMRASACRMARTSVRMIRCCEMLLLISCPQKNLTRRTMISCALSWTSSRQASPRQTSKTPSNWQRHCRRNSRANDRQKP